MPKSKAKPKAKAKKPTSRVYKNSKLLKKLPKWLKLTILGVLLVVGTVVVYLYEFNNSHAGSSQIALIKTHYAGDIAVEGCKEDVPNKGYLLKTTARFADPAHVTYGTYATISSYYIQNNGVVYGSKESGKGYNWDNNISTNLNGYIAPGANTVRLGISSTNVFAKPAISDDKVWVDINIDSVLKCKATPPKGNFVYTSGPNFMLKGNKFRFVGYNAPGMTGCYDYQGGWTDKEMDSYFSKLPNKSVTRISMYQALYASKSHNDTTLRSADSPAGYAVKANGKVLFNSPEEQFAKFMKYAKGHDQYVIPVLTNDIGACGDNDYTNYDKHDNPYGKTIAYYQGGWETYYKPWVEKIVPLYKDNPNIMMWEIAGEPNIVGSDEDKKAINQDKILKKYIKNTSNLIRSNDTNHLIGVGIATAVSVGGPADYTEIYSLPNVDAVSVHDYSFKWDGLDSTNPTQTGMISPSYIDAQNAAIANDKPFYVGETGVEAWRYPTANSNVSSCLTEVDAKDHNKRTMTTADRATYILAKMNYYFFGSTIKLDATNKLSNTKRSLGASGILLWDYEPHSYTWEANTTGVCHWAILPDATTPPHNPPSDDPLLKAIKNYSIK